MSAHGAGSLDEAADVVASSSIVSASQAAGIQQISEYNGSGSSYDISNTAAALISAGDTVLDNAGVDHVAVSETSVLANVGAQLNALSAEVEFDVLDTADIAANASGLDEADDVIVVSGGADVTVSQADPSKIYWDMMQVLVNMLLMIRRRLFYCFRKHAH